MGLTLFFPSFRLLLFAAAVSGRCRSAGRIFLSRTIMKLFTFPKAEHLCSQLDIERLFQAGSHSMTAYPLRVVFREVPHTSGPAVKVLMSVSKRRFRHAVDRNRAKRQLREAYRLRKSLLEELPEGKGLHLAFLWISDAPASSEQVGRRMNSLLLRLRDRYRPAVAPAVLQETEQQETEQQKGEQ